MQIQVNTDNNLAGGEDVARRVEGEVNSVLGHFHDRLTSLQVHLGDENSSDKKGANDKRCMIEARPRGYQPIAVEHRAPDLALAISGALDKMEKSLARTFGRLDDRSRTSPPPTPE